MAIWQDRFITVNSKSRPAFKLLGVRKLVLHYTANNGGTAMNHFNYFNNYKNLPRSASAHIFVDKTQALCIVPLNEVAYHANDKPSLISELRATASYYKGGNANLTSVGVEMCIERNGAFHPDTIKRTEDVFVELCKRYRLNPLTDIVRHYDITRKNCPAPWVRDGQKFIDFKKRVYAKLKGSPVNTGASPNPSTSSPSVFGKGDTGNTVKTIQTFLNQKGYKLVVDGDFGIATESAVKDFQKKNGLVVDGLVGTLTLAKLKTSSATKPKYTLPTPTLKIGSKGTEVKQLQTALNVAGFNSGSVDGVFGVKTQTALRSFQKNQRLVVDGLYGDKTKAALNNKIN